MAIRSTRAVAGMTITLEIVRRRTIHTGTKLQILTYTESASLANSEALSVPPENNARTVSNRRYDGDR